MSIIQVLGKTLSAQIAAGEVVERPASVIKEMMENSIDAGADRIRIDIRDGGQTFLSITDNGCGMEKSDAILCFSRHATSKFSAIEEFSTLNTYGFRGEALAAISSVAKVRLLTRQKDSKTGFEVIVHGGSFLSTNEAAAPLGTYFTIEDLFYNVPARKKYLKSTNIEKKHIEMQVKAQALADFSLCLSLFSDGKEIFSTPAVEEDFALDHPKRLKRLENCFPKQQVPLIFYPLNIQTELLAIKGYIASPEQARRDSKGIFLSVNKRPIEDKALLASIRLAFRPLLQPGRFPHLCLELSLPKNKVDINVHPQKKEVRFADERRLHSHLISTLTDFLASTPWQKKQPKKIFQLSKKHLLMTDTVPQKNSEHNITADQSYECATKKTLEENGTFSRSSPPPKKNFGDLEENARQERIQNAILRFEERMEKRKAEPIFLDKTPYKTPQQSQRYARLFTQSSTNYDQDLDPDQQQGTEQYALEQHRDSVIRENTLEKITPTHQDLPSHRSKQQAVTVQLLNIFKQRFLLVAGQKGELLIVDQPSLTAHIVSEHYLNDLDASSPQAMQKVLFPLRIKATKELKKHLGNKPSFFEKFLFVVESFSEEEVLLRKCPTALNRDRSRQHFEALLRELKKLKKGQHFKDIDENEQQKLSYKVSKAGISIKYSTNEREIQNSLEWLKKQETLQFNFIKIIAPNSLEKLIKNTGNE